MYELFKTLVNAAAFDRLFQFCRRAASRLFNRLKRAGLRAARNILATAQGVLSWIRRIGGILGRSLMRPLQPIRSVFQEIVRLAKAKMENVTPDVSSLNGRRNGRRSTFIPRNV